MRRRWFDWSMARAFSYLRVTGIFECTFLHVTIYVQDDIPYLVLNERNCLHQSTTESDVLSYSMIMLENNAFGSPKL